VLHGRADRVKSGLRLLANGNDVLRDALGETTDTGMDCHITRRSRFWFMTSRALYFQFQTISHRN
jgi:hypothetical protein